MMPSNIKEMIRDKFKKEIRRLSTNFKEFLPNKKLIENKNKYKITSNIKL